MDGEPSAAASSRSERILFSELRKLHIRAGEPSSRDVAAAIGGMSHTTVNGAVRGRRVPSWPVLSKIVKELGGDQNLFRGLWTAAREEGAEVERLPSPVGHSRPEVSVFVSYASIDEQATHGRITKIVSSIRDMYESMTGEEVGMFLDKDSLSAGENWRDAIKFELSSSVAFLAFLSPSYIRSIECNNEFWEFYRFLETNSSERLIVPLLFGDRVRTAQASPDTELWRTASELQMIDVSALRTVEPGQTVWLQKTQKIANDIDEALKSVRRTSARHAETAAEEVDEEELSPMLLEQMLRFEAASPDLQASMQNLTDLFYKVGRQVNGAGPLMSRATTTKRKLSVARQLARSIDPIADEVNDEVTTLIRTLKVWDVTVKTVFDFLRRSPDAILEETARSALTSVNEMANAGIEAFGEAEVMSDQIGQGRGLARELDSSLKKLQSAALRLADSRAMFVAWRIGAAEFLEAD